MRCGSCSALVITLIYASAGGTIQPVNGGGMGDKAKNILVWLVVALTLVLWVSLFLVFALPLP
jgi:hypothetical protein